MLISNLQGKAPQTFQLGPIQITSKKLLSAFKKVNQSQDFHKNLRSKKCKTWENHSYS